MNILQILPELNIGGVETGTVDFARYLVEKGHKSVVVSSGGRLVDSLVQGGSRHYELKVHKKNLFSILFAIKPLIKIIEDEQIDIVHARSRVPAWIAYFACLQTKAQFATTCHGYYKSILTSRVMGWGKRVIVPSRIIGHHMIEDFKTNSEVVRCIARSVDLNRFEGIKRKEHDPTKLVISIVGRITPLKGHSYFLKAMARVIREVPYAKVRVIGSAPAKKPYYLEDLKMLAKRLGISDRVEFLGARSDVPALLAETDILVMSSIEPESFGRVILEAQAARCPVVATQVGGVVDIIDDEETGLLVPPKDTEAMATQILRLIHDKVLVGRIVENADKKLHQKFLLKHMAEATIAVYEECINIQSILVIKLGAIGDVILITASLKALRNKFPQARIICLVGKQSRKILQNCPYLDGLIVFDHKRKDLGLFRILKFAKKLRVFKFDKVIDFQNNRKSHLMAFLTLAKERYGYRNKKLGFLLNRGIRDTGKKVSPVAHQFEILKEFDIKDKGVVLELWPSQQDKDCAKELLESEWLKNVKNIVGINLAASERWQTKNWPIEHWAEVCDRLSEKNIRVIITGIEKDMPAYQQLRGLVKSKPANFIGRTDVMQLAALIKYCKVFLTPDSAPMHVAAAMHVPFIAFFGPTDSERHLPPAKRFVVMEKKLECAPCYNTRCNILTHACMKDITVNEVMVKIEELLK